MSDTASGAPIPRREALRRLGGLGALFGLAAGGGTLATLASACTSGPRAARPVDLALGGDECAWCRMTVDDAHLAAELVPERGAVVPFGEPGCLLAWLDAHPEVRGTAFVTAADGGGWLAATDAHYLRGRVRTPMAFDLAAYRALPADAAPDAALTWATLRREGAPRVESHQ